MPAFSLGLFVAYLPFPGHMLIAGLSALALRVNIPVAVASVWVSNPATMVPMFYAAYEVGRRLLRLDPSHLISSCRYSGWSSALSTSGNRCCSVR